MPARTVRLSRLLCDDRPGDEAIAFGRGGDRCRADLYRSVSAVAASIDRIGRGPWLVHAEDSYGGAVALLALWGVGSSAVLSPNRQPETLRRIGAQVRAALIDGAAEGLPADVSRVDPLDASPDEAALSAPDRDSVVAEFRTSGTTGDEKAVAKALRHLEDEVATLETLFGDALPDDARFFATVSHQHIYGLLFRVLWPLASGRPFQRETLLHPQELVPRMSECESSALVTTPAHLRRMAAGDGLRPLRGSCRAVFSSGAPLDPDTAKSVAEQIGEAPREILGSTETGGVAVRQRDVHGDSWFRFPGVRVECDADSRLVVRSPFASDGELTSNGSRAFTTGDRARLRSDGSFELLERADRTVKIGGVRLSLPTMERELQVHPWVEEAALVVLEQAFESRVYAVVVPTEEGRAVLRERGRRGLGAGLSAQLAERFDRVLLPRAWRSVDEMPRDARGKLPAAALRALFEERRRDPVSLLETREERVFERRLEVPADLAALEGHFAGMPVVPGVEQLRWAVETGAELLGHAPPVRGIEALKFPTVLRPGDRATLRVEVSPARDRLRFRLADGDRVFASGRCILETEEGAS